MRRSGGGIDEVSSGPRHTTNMHPCPCCGYKTLTARSYYELCPVCWWEDEGTEPWEFSDPNGETLVEAQQRFLQESRPYRLRDGKVRAPKKREARAQDWRPIEVTDELLAKVEEAKAEQERLWEEEERRANEVLAELDPEEPLQEYNEAHRALLTEAKSLSHREVKQRLRAISNAHGPRFGEAHLELMARWMKDERYYRGHPIRTAWWLLRYVRPRRYGRHLQEVRRGTIYMAG